ncbi:hypothetical protein M408DRAFT_216256 [Serendipita vermifera MAFF 305830]|uniref:Pre-mRNA polyadenylation factor Fip1 domain-containing protein n=1 Tax=Serendipita vermifera MAFF 305830 TaxID=933852 RepID=A0A0C3BLE1_SERVB|nr:hypothetical protein M408DRAFT_216256 [Serendipita vermifera MAFF 305830]
MDEEDSEEEIEIITDGPVQPVTRSSIDYRPRVPPSGSQSGPHGTLTTEYKPLERDATIKKLANEPPAQAPVAVAAPKPVQSAVVPETKPQAADEPQVDPSTLPVVTAPATAPKIELNKDGTMDGRSIYEVDIASLENKGWRRPGSDLSDWFNYGFDEISWEAYAVRRRDLGEMAPILKANVLSFSSMSEEQVLNLPNDLRGMVMMGSHMAANTMGNQNQGANMMGNAGGGGMHPDMMNTMGMMGNMPAGMGPNGPTGMNAPGPQMMMQGMNEGEGAPVGPNMMQGMEYPNNPMGNMGMDYLQEQMPPTAPQGGFPLENTPTVPAGPRGAAAFRGRGQPVVVPVAPRGRGAPAFRGRGRGGAFDVAPPTGPRAASPLPPNVPTGPRNQHRYKDRDTGAPTSEPLDYGGEAGGSGSKDRPLRDEFGRDIDRSSKDDDSKSSRKRRGSPPEDGGRSSKRR